MAEIDRLKKVMTAERGQAAPARDWTRGSIIGNLLSLSWPIVVHNALYMVGQTVDMIWIGKLGATAVAGVGVAFIVHMLVLAAKMGLVTGARAMVARFMGAGDTESANHAVGQAFLVSAVFGVVVSVLGILLAEPILSLFGLKAEVVAMGTAYMRVMFSGWIFYSLWLMAFSVMQASGDAITPMKIHIFTRSVQVLLSPFLVFGWWFFPRLGVSGAALGMILGQGLGMAISLWILLTGRSRLRLTFRGSRLDPSMIWRMVKIGLPACIMGMQGNLGQLVLMWVIAPFGTLAVAAHTLNQRVEMIAFMPSVGLGMGAGVLVGQNLGARQPQRAERTGWLAAGLVEAIMLTCAAAVLLWAENIVRIFNSEPELVALASLFLRIAAAGYLLNGFITGLQNSISGAGDTLPPMMISLAMTWLVLLPLAFLLPQFTNLGVYGVRWAMVISLVVGAAAYIVYFRLGRWKRKRV
jgi:putative MATE family efflux protein